MAEEELEEEPTNEEDEEVPEEAPFNIDAQKYQRLKESIRRAREVGRVARQQAGRVRAAAGEARTVSQGAQVAGQAAKAAGQAAIQAAKVAVQVTGRAVVAAASNPYVLAAIAIFIAVIIGIIILVFIIYSRTSPKGGSAPRDPNPTVQADMALTAKFRSIIGDPLNTDIAKKGAELLKQQLTASQQTLAAKTDQDSQKLKQKIDQAIGKLDEIIAEANKSSPDDVKIKKLVADFFQIYDSLPGLSKNIAIAEKAREYAKDDAGRQAYTLKTTCEPTSCSGFVETVMRVTGADKNYRGTVKVQWEYVQAHPGKYLTIPGPQLNKLAPGDILIRTIPGTRTTGHTAIYIGHGEIASASLGDHKPLISSFSNTAKDGQYKWQYAARLID